MNGIVTGGWNFVLAAYIVTGTALISYSIYAISDFRKRMANRDTLNRIVKGTSA